MLTLFKICNFLFTLGLEYIRIINIVLYQISLSLPSPSFIPIRKT